MYSLPKAHKADPIPPPHYEDAPENADSEVVWEVHFQNTSLAAVYYALNHLYQELYCTSHMIVCKEEPFANIELPHNIFSWDKNHCMQRRELTTVWFSLLLQQLSPQCLEIRKLFIDIQELMRYIKIISEGYFQLVDENDYKKAVDEAKEYLDLEINMQKEYEMHMEFMSLDVINILMGQYIRRLTRELRLSSKKILNEEFMIMDPVATEYKTRHLRNEESQCYWRNKIKENRIHDNTKATEQKIKNEHFVTRIVINVYAAENEMLRQRIADIKHANDVDSEYCQIEHFKMITKLEKLRASRKYLAEQINWFHVEIEEFHIKEKNREERQLMLLEQQRLKEKQKLEELAELKRQRRRAKAGFKNKLLFKNLNQLKK